MRQPILTALLTLTFYAGKQSLAASACPAPSVQQGGQCILTSDATINDTMWIASGTHLNCQGHRIEPAATGVLDDPRTTANEFQPSRPELAIFVRKAYNVTIQNCVISGFDFGIIVAQSKAANAPAGVPPTNSILGNTIDVRTNAIDVTKSDGVVINGNKVTYASERGRGIVVNYDSDYNLITTNTITSTDAASTGQVRNLPGGSFVTNTETELMDTKIHILQSNTPLQNFVVSGILVQVPAGELNTNFEDTGRSDHNLIAANNIVDLGVGQTCTLDPGKTCKTNTDCSAVQGLCLLKQDSGIGFNSRASDNLVLGNRLSGRMQRGISFAGIPSTTTIAGWYPGTCTLKSSQLCSTDADCNITGYNTPGGVGSCMGAQSATFNGNTMRLTATGNFLSGEYDIATLFANNTDGFHFSGNVVNGGANGIRLQAKAINGTVERNLVSGATEALYLAFQPSFTNSIKLNDFTHYSVAIRTSDDFTTHMDISADKGNYWGLPCPGFTPSRVLFDSGLVNPYVFDGKPYGQPVALTPDFLLPTRCH